ncbi:hypothetical protein Glove_192g30 [Diversispora epigaea]|uniref:SAM domain-containing protein n=1 Tax=Diversispora epigaea TaxID=1348612 RepID=A0A397IUK3_9GLOM|nr:hypothetical protein Glove_192g30 [Diversispora epigaea]
MSSYTSSPISSPISSSISSPISTFSTITEERSTRTMADNIRKYKTEELIDYLQRQDLDLKESYFKIFRQKEISGFDFLETTKEEFCNYGLKAGPAKRLTEFINNLKKQKIRNFSSYKTLKELKDILHKYKVNGEDITCIKQFNPVFEEINDDDKALEQCINEIILRLTNIKSMTDANEATRCEFISSILHASIAISQRLTNKEINIELQRNISGEEAFGRVNYIITGMEDLLCITEGKPRNIKIGYLQNIKQLESLFHMNKWKRTADEIFKDDYNYLYGIVSTGIDWHFIIFASEGIFCTSNSEYQINLTKITLKKNCDILKKDIKQIISIIVGLLKDKISTCDEPGSKKLRVQEKIIKKITR